MPYVIKLITLASGGTTVHDGRYLKRYEAPAMRRGYMEGGCIESTDKVGDALQFPDAVAACEKWREQNGTRWYDGKPNRPLTAWTVEIEPVAAH